MTLPRVLNFALFCVVAVAMLGTEVAWTRDLIDHAMRTRLHYVGFSLLGVTMAVEIVFEWLGEGGGRSKRRGFPVIWQRKDKAP